MAESTATNPDIHSVCQEPADVWLEFSFFKNKVTDQIFTLLWVE